MKKVSTYKIHELRMWLIQNAETESTDKSVDGQTVV